MIKKLISIGLSTYESRAYEALIKEGLLTASRVSEIADIPQGRVYSILKSLEQRGFCNMYSGSVKIFEAVNPKIAFQGLIREKEMALKEIEEIGNDLEEVLTSRQSESAPVDFIQTLTSKQSQINKFDELIKTSKETLCSFNKKPYAMGFLRSMDEIVQSSTFLRESIHKGITNRGLYEAEDVYIKEFTQMVKYYQEVGEEVRICKQLPLKMLLSDEKLDMVSMQSNDSVNFKLTSMVVEHSDLTNALMELFEMHWEKGITIEAYLDSVENSDSNSKES